MNATPGFDYIGRRHKLDEALRTAEVDALVLTNLTSIQWLIGFTGSNATVVVTSDGLHVITDGRYEQQVGEQLTTSKTEASITIDRDADGVVALRCRGLARIGLESDNVTWHRQQQLNDRCDGAVLVPLNGLVADLRMVKDEAELAALSKAASLADSALDSIAPRLGGGLTERDVARLLDDAMRDGGADEPSFETIVASGPNSALPHHRPSDRRIRAGDLVIIDMGARVDGYGSDMTRSFMIGDVDDHARHLYAAVAEAQMAGLSTVRAGVAERDVDEVCRQSLAAHGLADAFVHGTGHGIGLEIHEIPFLSARSEGVLRSGSVITIEPGAYIPGFGGVRIEDSVVVTERGCHTITNSPKDPVITTAG